MTVNNGIININPLHTHSSVRPDVVKLKKKKIKERFAIILITLALKNSLRKLQNKMAALVVT